MKTNLYLILVGIIMISNISIAKIYPCGGENGEFWSQSSIQKIKWDTSGFEGNLDIYLWNMNSATFSSIAINVPDSLGEYTWSIPSNQAIGNYFRIMIMQSNDTSIYELSDTFFPIYEGSSQYNDVSENMLISLNLSIYPNPSSNNTTIKYEVLKSELISIKILNLLGENVLTLLVDEFKEVGSYYLDFNSYLEYPQKVL